MEEKNQFKKQFAELIALNLLCFMIILAICCIFIFTYVRNNTYRSIDIELEKSLNKIMSFDYDNRTNSSIINELEDIENEIFKGPYREKIDLRPLEILEERLLDSEDEDGSISAEQKENDKGYLITREIGNPNVIVILRDSDGNIINTSELGRMGEIAKSIPFDNTRMNEIYEVEIESGSTYYYRMITSEFETEKQDSLGTKYVQILINVDSEKALVDRIFRMIMTTLAVGAILSAGASYLLSKNNIKEIQSNLDKQTEFVQNASHELRTPLTIIQAKQELLLQEPNAKIVDKSEDIVLTLNETKRLSKLIKDLMLLTRSDSKTVKLNKESVKIDDYLSNLVEPYKEVAELQNKKISLDLNFNSEIDIDTSKIYQLMIILLDNAIKYTEEGDTIEVRSSADGNKCTIEVADTGIGISDEGIKRVFERFYREDKARSRETGGSGLGLSIAKVIVQEHGGTIKASHNNPKGTIFTIKLPR